MSAVVGIDLSTRALDLVKLDESSNRAEWVRCELEGANAWERTLAVRRWLLPGVGIAWWDDVYLVAIEAPYGRGQAGTNAILNRVVGAVAASLPARLRDPARCWLVAPHEWKAGLGLKGKPTSREVARLAEGFDWPKQTHAQTEAEFMEHEQHFLDAYCLALYAREQNRKGVAA